MEADPRALESLLAFWADAGVDVLYDEAPKDRTAKAAPPPASAPAPRPAAAPALAVPPSTSPAPADLERARAAAAQAPDIVQLADAARLFFASLAVQPPGPLVFGQGAIPASVFVVADPPDAWDEAAGAPLASPAGRMFARALEFAGLADRAFVTGVVLHRPRGDMAPDAAAVALAAPFLDRVLELSQP
ncbi:MAG: uracil-DNA glycosylase, partial [Caulobacteraceae bacterium]|nr:uracil-DNA glycosylase [Caulobacteraceae bacterium]